MQSKRCFIKLRLNLNGYSYKFNFEEKYGSVAQGFIHVHHLKPLSEIREEYEVDPVANLLPVCPNCHAVIHLGGKTRSIEEVKSYLQH